MGESGPVLRNRDVFVAADFPAEQDLWDFLAQFPAGRPAVKVGMELFYGAGPDLVRRLKNKGHPVFVDLKLHDIPNTVESAMRVLADLDVDMVNVHAAGGKVMMQAALRGLARPEGERPLLIAVTQLTSTDQTMLDEELLIGKSVAEAVTHYAKNAADVGLDGVVCSPNEVRAIKDLCGEDFLTVTPGVRMAGADLDDQVRVATPAQAREDGADFIVVGRPITRAANPLVAYQEFCDDFGVGR